MTLEAKKNPEIIYEFIFSKNSWNDVESSRSHREETRQNDPKSSFSLKRNTAIKILWIKSLFCSSY